MHEADELLLVNGHFRTLDPDRPEVESVAIRNGIIVATGSEEACRSILIHPQAIDLQGAWGYPGLVDAHGHLLGLGAYRTEVDLVGCRSEAEVAERVAAKARGMARGSWIKGFGWNQSLWPGGGFPTHELLSRLVPDHPVWLTRIDGHAGLANDRALRLAGIGPDTRDPPGGRIVRGPGGHPTGVLIDTAMVAIQDALPALSPEEREKLLLLALDTAAACGLTSVHDAGMDGETLEVAMALDREGRLPIRIYAMVDGTRPGLLGSWLERGPFVGRHLTVRCVKLFLDGALGSRGAAFFDEYSDDPGNRGLTLLAPDAYRETLRRAHASGFQVAVHAIGDRANAEALDGFADVGLPPSARPRLEHAQILRRSDIPKVAALGVIASMQPSHCIGDMPFVEARIGCRRLGGAFAWRSLSTAGATLAFGSDFPIESPDPLRGLHAAVTRREPSAEASRAFEPSESLEIGAALEAFTKGAAFAAFEEHKAGSIRPGFRADLSFFDADLLAADPDSLLQLRAVGTMVSGRFAWVRGGSAVEAALVPVAE